MSHGEFQCIIDFNINDSPPSVSAFAQRLTPLFSHAGRTNLDLSNCKYFGPDAAAIIAATILESRTRGDSLQVTLPTSPLALAAFCEFSGLNHYLMGSPFSDANHPDNVTVPATRLTKSSFDDANPILALVRRYVHVSDETEEYLRICVNEVVQNVQDHACSEVGAILCARFIEHFNQIRVAIVDRGVGIATSLQRRHSDIPDAKTALERVIQGGISAQSRPNNMGLGISNLCAIIIQVLGGELFIISEDGLADGKHGRQLVSRTLTDTRFAGTGVFFTIPVK